MVLSPAPDPSKTMRPAVPGVFAGDGKAVRRACRTIVDDGGRGADAQVVDLGGDVGKRVRGRDRDGFLKRAVQRAIGERAGNTQLGSRLPAAEVADRRRAGAAGLREENAVAGGVDRGGDIEAGFVDGSDDVADGRDVFAGEIDLDGGGPVGDEDFTGGDAGAAVECGEERVVGDVAEVEVAGGDLRAGGGGRRSCRRCPGSWQDFRCRRRC